MPTATAVIERPILFSGPMVRALLGDRKTQTRRVATPPAKAVFLPDDHWRIDPDEPGTAYLDDFSGRLTITCPYGEPGDRLWVRETWASPERDIVAYHADAECGAYLGDGAGGRLWIRHGVIHESPNYAAARFPATTQTLAKYGGRWKPSIHMPRWASRITLEITEVRIERLRQITPDDAEAEGIAPDPTLGNRRAIDTDRKLIADFRALWDGINAARGFGWEADPWVWVIGFRRVTP